MDGAHHGRCILGHYTTSINFKWAPAWLGSRPRGVGARRLRNLETLSQGTKQAKTREMGRLAQQP